MYREKNLAEILIEIVLNRSINFERIYVLTMLILLIHEHEIFLHLLRFSLTSFMFRDFQNQSSVCFVRFKLNLIGLYFEQLQMEGH